VTDRRVEAYDVVLSESATAFAGNGPAVD
jgi:hypothetical protein